MDKNFENESKVIIISGKNPFFSLIVKLIWAGSKDCFQFDYVDFDATSKHF